MKVLVVVDSAKLQISLSSGLQDLGYTVDVVADGSEAIAYASSGEYDIIILDLTLPKNSSLLVLHELRESNREVEILILSQPDQIHDRVTGLIQGADDYLVKPFSIDDLHARIQSLLRHKINQQSPQGNQRDSSAHLNRLINNLLKLCHCEQGAIELVISETKLADLLNRVYSNSTKDARQKNITLNLPVEKLPTLFIDASLMEHLLTIVISNAIRQSPRDREIKISFQPASEHCALEIESAMSESLSRDELKTMLKDFYVRGQADKIDQPIAGYSLVKSYADCMNLRLNALLTNENLLRIRVSNIKII